MRNQRNREDRDVRRNDIDIDDDVRQGGNRRSGNDDMERSAGQGSRRGGMNMPGSQSRPQTRSRKKK